MNSFSKKSDDPARKSARKKWKTKLRKSDQEKLPENFDVPGVKRVVLNKEIQVEIRCIVGEQITYQHPWIFVPKEVIEDNITCSENSEFLQFKADIANYPRNKLLLAYTPNSDKDYDEFYLCLTENAEDTIYKLMKKNESEQDAVINSVQYKTPGMWVSLGSELKIEECTERANRALLAVEIETAYPIISPKSRFKMRLPHETKDGYEELLTPPTQLAYQVLRKMRTDVVTQVTPSVTSQSSQTDFTFPKNTWAQYLFEYKVIEELSDNFAQNFTDFASKNLGNIYNHLEVNHDLNFYINDYITLISDSQYTITPEDVHWEEYMSFANLQDGHNKMISSISWHPMWSGTVAIAYSNVAPNVYRRGRQTVDEVNAIIHEVNPILLWSFNDGLKPKLHLECSKKIECISFCPFDENIIVGASINGQIIVWDIRNKIEKVEEVEILTTAQQKYRFMMRSLMNWMKNTQDVSHVKATIESNYIFSHSTAATGILWIPPYIRMTNLGKYELIGKDKPSSKQFATCSLDGTILFWDLLDESVAATAPEYKPRKPSQRLKVQLSALNVDASPFIVLNKRLKPFYKLSVLSSTTSEPHLLASIASYPITINYENPDPDTIYSDNGRIVYKPVITAPSSPLPPEIYCGSYDGYILKATWEGCDDELENLVSQENCAPVNVVRYHDGPVVNIEKHPVLLDTYLTVGGKVFAIWKDNLQDKPVFWRKSLCRYTHGKWDKHSTSLRLCRSDGNREIWYLPKHSHKIYYEQNISGEMILGSYLHTLGNVEVLGVSDYNGTFRMFYLPESNGDDQQDLTSLDILLDREVARKQLFIKWQSNWLKKNEHIIQEREEKIKLKQQQQMEREKSEKKKKQEEKLRVEKERRRLAALQEKAPPGEYFKWTAQKWQKGEHDRMQLGLLMKKRLIPEVLAVQQMPLKKLEQAEDKKKRKQVEIVQNSEKIFTEKVSTVFPNFFKRKPPPPWNPYGGGESRECKQACLDEYEAITEEASQFIQDNQFAYEFNWNQIIHQRRNRRSELESRSKIRRQRTVD